MFFQDCNLYEVEEKRFFFKSMIFEYLIIFQQSGSVLFSKDLRNKTQKLKPIDEKLISGFFLAIATLPRSIGYKDKELKSLEMGNSKVFFAYGNGNVTIALSVAKVQFEFSVVRQIICELLSKIKFFFDGKIDTEGLLISDLLGINSQIEFIFSSYT